MDLAVFARSETPLYQQLYGQIVKQIVNGTLAPQEKLPSIRLVARELEISVIPVKAAYELLEKEGYIFTMPAKGCFVANLSGNEQQNLAKEQLQKAWKYCQNLGISKEDFVRLATECDGD